MKELTNWTVFLATGSEKEVEIAGRRRNCILRTPREPRDGKALPDDRFIIGTALSPLDQAIDLTDAEFEEALARTNQERRSRTNNVTNIPSGKFIRKVRGGRPQNGLLIIYPIDPDKAEVEPTERPVISVVVSFPDSEAADDRVYRITLGGEVSSYYRGLGRPQGLAFDRDGNLYVAASHAGRRGIVRITPDSKAEVILSGSGLVGLALLPSGRAILTTNAALFTLDWDVRGLPLFG